MTFSVTLGDLTVGDGTAYRVLRSTNLWGAPDLRTDPLNRSGRHGVAAGIDLLGGRRIAVTIGVREADMDAALLALREVTAAWGPQATDVPLVWTDGTGSYRLLGRPQLANPLMENVASGNVDVDCRFLATDPRIFSDTEQSAATGFPEGGVGRTYDLTFPRVYGAAGSGGGVSATNDGTTATTWRATIVGPWVNPTITNVATGDVLSLSISIAAGETLVLDSADESILLGSAHRLNSVLPGSVWPSIEPGANELRFGGASGSGTATLEWRSAWI